MMRSLPVALVLSLVGCAVDPMVEPTVDPTDPDQGKPRPPRGSNLTGTIFEPTPGGPIPLAGVAVYISQPDRWVQTLYTDANGRYAANIASGEFIVQASKANYEMPCAATGTHASGTASTKNIELYTHATLSAGGASAPAGSSPVYSGTVYANGTPVAGAQVWVVDIWDRPLASTITDVHGGYFVCRVPNYQDLIANDGEHYSDYYPVGVASDQTLDLELL